MQVKSLAEKARTGKLKPHEFQGGTFRSAPLSDIKITYVDCHLGGFNYRYSMYMCFDDSGRISFVGYMRLTLWACGLWYSSISNLGMFQVDHFCAIINPPQVLPILQTFIFPNYFHSVTPNKLYFSILSYLLQSSYQQHPWHIVSYMFPCDCDGSLRIDFPCMQACILAVGRGVKKVVWGDEFGKLAAPC